MADIVNLNRFRKATKARDDKARAAANRTLHGRSGAERAKLESERDRARGLLDGHRLTGVDGGESDDDSRA